MHVRSGLHGRQQQNSPHSPQRVLHGAEAVKTSVVVAFGSIVACLGAFGSSPSVAAPVLDAFYAGSPSGGAPRLTFALNASNPILAQTFTAQASGRLTSYGIYVVPAASGTSGSLTVGLVTTGSAGDLVGGNLLVQRQIGTAAFATPSFYDFDVSASGVDVAAGTTYALVATTGTANPAFGIGGDTPGTYAGGVTYFGQPSSLQLAAGTDLYFRTFVDAAATGTSAPNPSPVPEPAAAALLGVGLFGLGLLRRKQA